MCWIGRLVHAFPHLIALGALLALLSAPGDVARAKVRPKPPILLMFHAGGFIFDCTTPCLAWAEGVAERRGFEARDIEYPLGSVPAAMAAAVDAVPPRRHVFAYGESAGGLLAARLAQSGRVEAAAVQSPVANLPFYLSSLSKETGDYSLAQRLQVPTLSDQRRYSPASHGAVNRIFAVAAADDPLMPSTLAWAKKVRRVSAVSVPGDHLDSTGTLYPSRVRLLIRWLAHRALEPIRHHVRGGTIERG
jgi:acetyl esterase/lipase